MNKVRCAMQKLIICLGILLTVCISKDCQAAKYLKVTANAKNKTTVEISWKKKKVSGYEIYRAINDDNFNEKKYKKIATVSGKKTKYTDKMVKYNQNYIYMVKAYQKKKKRKIYKYKGTDFALVAMTDPDWEEYLATDTMTSSSAIRLSGYTEGITPDGFEIYRKTGSEKYKKIKTVKNKRSSFEFKDTKVSKGRKYTYKFRYYKKLNGRKVYSKYSYPVKLRAVNRDATYTVQNDTAANGKTTFIVAGLTSNEGNGTTIFGNSENYVNYTWKKNKNAGKSYSIDLVPVKYSYDNVNWVELPEKGVKVNENETIYIMFVRYDGTEEFDFYCSDVYSSKIEWWLTYNDRHAILSIDFIKTEASASANAEYYH